MNINRIPFHPMRHELHCKYHCDMQIIIGRLPQKSLDAIAMDAFLPPYRAAYGKEEELLDMICKSDITKPIVKTDRARDRTCTGFVGAVKNMLYHYDKEVNDAAGRVLDGR